MSFGPRLLQAKRLAIALNGASPLIDRRTLLTLGPFKRSEARSQNAAATKSWFQNGADQFIGG